MEPSLETEGGLGQGSHSRRGVDADQVQAELGGDLFVLRDQTFTLPTALSTNQPHLCALHCEEIHPASVNLQIRYEGHHVK